MTCTASGPPGVAMPRLWFCASVGVLALLLPAVLPADSAAGSASIPGVTGCSPASTARSIEDEVARLQRAEETLGRLLDHCLALIDAGKTRDALPLLQKARQELGERRDVRLETMLGRAALAEKRPDKALEFVGPYLINGSPSDPATSEARLVGAEAHLALGKARQALELFDHVAGASEGLTLILAAEGCGRALFILKDFPKAVECFDFALKVIKSLKDSYGTYDKLSARIKQQLDAAKRLADVDLYGEDFVLYRDAETLRRVRNKPADARAIYLQVIQKFPQGAYADASRLYAARCMADLGKPAEAERELAALRQSDPYGPYAGEALLDLGVIALEHHLEPRAARGAFLLLDTWLREVRDKKPLNVERLAVPEAARAVTTPPREEKYVDFWGNVKKSEIKPGMLVNAATCPWYLDDLKEQMSMYLGFLCFVDGDKEGALKWHAQILECDPATRRLETEGEWNDYSRLKWGAEHGYLYAYPQELALFKNPKHRLGVLLCDFYYVTQQWEKSRSLAKNLLDGAYGPVSPAAREYVQFVHAAGVFRTQGREKAIPEYLKALRAAGQGDFKTLTQQRAAFAGANLGRLSRDEKTRQLARELLARLVRSSQQTTHTYKARILLARDLIQEQKTAEGLAILKTFPRDGGDYKVLADYYASEYEKRHEHQGKE